MAAVLLVDLADAMTMPTMRIAPDVRHTIRHALTPRAYLDIRLLRASRQDMDDMILSEAAANPLLAPRDPVPSSRRIPRAHAGDRAARTLDDIAAPAGGLRQHLLEQLRMTDLAPPHRDVAALIVDELDPDGYLRTPLAEIAALVGVTADVAGRALACVQACDPPGVGARDLAECLDIQLAQRGFPEDAPAVRLVRHHLPLLAQRRFDRLAQVLGVDGPAVAAAAADVVRLEPKPGRPFIEEESVSVRPDVFIERMGPEWVVSLNDAGAPRLRQSPLLRVRLERGDDGPALRSWVDDRRRSAHDFLGAIERRRRMLHRLVTTLVRLQPDFLDQGPAALRPLTLAHVAAVLEVHESTVSRAVADKYAETPLGVIPLKSFFASAVSVAGRRAMSADAVKGRLFDLVRAESVPLNDQALRDRLAAEGIAVSRRTVQSYREALRIPPASERGGPAGRFKRPASG